MKPNALGPGVVEEWRPVEGLDGVFEVSSLGRIRRTRGTRRGVMKPMVKKHVRGIKRVARMTVCGKRIERTMGSLVASAFVPGRFPGAVAHHLNGNTLDDRPENLAWISRRELGHRTGRMSTQRGVLKVSRDGAIVGSYSSGRSAARDGYTNKQSVADCANGKIKSGFCQDGFRYVWDDTVEASILIALWSGASPASFGVSRKQLGEFIASNRYGIDESAVGDGRFNLKRSQHGNNR